MDDFQILHRLIHLFKAKEERQFKATGLSAREWYVLEHTREDNAWRFNDFAENYQIKPSTLTSIVERLEKKGLVERVRGEEDRKAVYLKPTAQGKDIMTKHIEEDLLFFSSMLSHLAPTEKEQFINLVRRITDSNALYNDE